MKNSVAFGVLAAVFLTFLLIVGPRIGVSAPAGESPPIGRVCIVQFRRDALGSGAALPVPPRTGSMNGAATSVTGTLRQVSPDWVVLQVDAKDLWIPRSVVLLIEAEHS